MIRPLLVGLVTGLRSFTPLAVLSFAVNQRRLPIAGEALSRLATPPVVAGAGVLAITEMAGDKLRWAPDRNIPPGLAVRAIAGGLAGVVVSSREHRRTGAIVGAAAAVLGGVLGLKGRLAVQSRYGQIGSGLMEDALTIALTLVLVGEAARRLPAR